MRSKMVMEREAPAEKLPRPCEWQHEGDPSWQPPHEKCDPRDCRAVAACKKCEWIGIMGATLHQRYGETGQGRVCPSCREAVEIAAKCVNCGRWTRGGRKVRLVTGSKSPVCAMCEGRLQQ